MLSQLLHPTFSELELVLFILWMATLCIQLYFYFFQFNGLMKYRSITKLDRKKPVSIIIAAKNELENLKAYLPLVLNQNHEIYEVIVVNNFSTDGTWEYLSSLNHERLKVFDYAEKKGKKVALQAGIQQAKYEMLLFTDADCRAQSEDWVSTMTGAFGEKIEFVLGYGAFEKQSTWLNKVIRFEGLLTAIQYFSFALKGEPYMGVGRNLAYLKSTFTKAEGFNSHSEVLSGDDDLIVNQMGNAENIALVLDRGATMISYGEASWLTFYRQKRRQLLSGNLYKVKDRIKLALFGASNFLYYALLVSLLLNFENTTFILGIFVVKQVCEYIVFFKLCRQLGNKDLIKWLPIVEPFYLVFIIIAGVSTWFQKVDRWK